MGFEKTYQNNQAEPKGKASQENKRKVGAALLRLQQSFPEEEVNGEASLQDFFRELRKPRSKEYIEQVRRCMELSRRIAEIKEALDGEQNIGKRCECPKDESPKSAGGNREGGGGPQEGILSEKKDTQESKPIPAWLPKAASTATMARIIEWKGSERNRMQEELDRLEWELKQQQKQLYDRMPKGDPYLASVYLTKNEEELFRRGIIIRGGVPYSDVEELFQTCNVTTEQERSMLILADRAVSEWPNPLVVEVYLHAVCKVFADGSTQMIRG